MRRVMILTASVLGLVSTAWASARLDYQGPLFARRQAESWFTPVLKAPGDSAAVSAALARMVSGLQNAGYLDAHATAQWDTVRGEPHLSVRIAEGRRQRIVAMAVDTPSPADSLALARALGVGIGD